MLPVGLISPALAYFPVLPQQAARTALSQWMRCRNLQFRPPAMLLSLVVLPVPKSRSPRAPEQTIFAVPYLSTFGMMRLMPTTGLLTGVAFQNPLFVKTISVLSSAVHSSCPGRGKGGLYSVTMVAIGRFSSSPMKDCACGSHRFKPLMFLLLPPVSLLRLKFARS